MSTVRIKKSLQFKNLINKADELGVPQYNFKVKNGIYYFTGPTNFLKDQGFLSYK